MLRRVALSAIVTSYLAAGLAPFHFDVPRRLHNGARTGPEGFVSFPSPGIAVSEKAPEWLRQAIDRQQLELELEVSAGSSHQDGPARIFTISRGTEIRNLTIGQEGDDLDVRVRSDRTDANGLPSYVVKDVFRTSLRRRIAVRIAQEWVRVVVDGVPRIEDRLPRPSFLRWDPSFRFALGNEVFGRRPWLGEIHQAIVRAGDQQFDLLQSEGLRLPRRYWSRRTFDKVSPFLPRSPGPSSIWDWTLNTLGFAPAGIAFRALGTRRRPRSRYAAWCLFLSLGIEIGQVFVAERSPQLTDVFLNTSGGFLGAWLADSVVRGKKPGDGPLAGSSEGR
jgi:VanZ family protein